ncbi:MAG: T9SS type A sorting domain-containing protein [Candidatus Marinimicrobia bacterium]|nr:T9SS type A sorting domain-containing protein [Candidatus Neomarinimicrobiota bacterium]
MKRLLTVLLFVSMIATASFAGWNFEENVFDFLRADTLISNVIDLKGNAHFNGMPHGIVVDDAGNFWVAFYASYGEYFVTDGGDTSFTKPLYVIAPDGNVVKKIDIFDLPDGGKDTLWAGSAINGSARGIGMDNDGNILYSSWKTLYRFDQSTFECTGRFIGLGSLTDACQGSDGTYYIGHVGGGNPVFMLDADFELIGNAIDTVATLQRSVQIFDNPNGGFDLFTGPIYSGVHGLERYHSDDPMFESFVKVDTLMQWTYTDESGNEVVEAPWCSSIDVIPNGDFILGTLGISDAAGPYRGYWYVMDPYTDVTFEDAQQFGVWDGGVLAPVASDPFIPGGSNSPRGAFAVDNNTIFTVDFRLYTLDKWVYSEGGGDMEMVVADEVLFNGAIPTDLYFKPGKILDNGSTIWFCGVNSGTKETFVFRSVDGGKTFTHNATGIVGRAAQMDAYNADVAVVACANGKIYKTSDGGANFTEVYSYSLGLGEGWFDGLRIVNGVAIAFGDEATDGNMHFVKSIDMGDTWTKIEGIDYLNAAYAYYTFGTASCVADGIMWATGTSTAYAGGFVFKTTDNGATWTSVEVDPAALDSSYIRSIGFTDANNGMLANRRGGIARTSDGGATWAAIDLPVGAEWVNGIVAVPGTGRIYAMDDAGMYYTDDLGENWGEVVIPEDAENDDYYISGLFANNTFGFAFTDDGQVMKFKGQKTTAIEREKVEVAETYILNQNYPNPFNPTTTITFEIPQTENIKLVVYDMLGQKVATLLESRMNAGYHTVQWDGRDMNGQVAAAGVYLYQLQTPNMLKTKKMTFIK